jgi:histidine triad (HIT) family protein
MPCIFCEIVAGKIPAKTVYSDDDIIAFHDINPQAPTHVVVIPRRHITSLLDLQPEDDALAGALVRKGRDIAREMGFGERGFRLVMNAGDDAGYSVYHIHLHVLAGRQLGWPPG